MSALPIYEHLPNIIYYGKSPERDREIDIVCEMIRTPAWASTHCATTPAYAHRPHRAGGGRGTLHDLPP